MSTKARLYGLLRPSFIPTREQREPRDLTRTRTSLTDERTAAVNRVRKVLEDANITRASVATDIMGTSGRDILAALLDGTADAATMALLARGTLRRTRAALEQAVQGRMSAHHRLLLTLYLEQSDLLDEHIARLGAQIAERLRPYEADLQRLETIPGVGRRTAGLDRRHARMACMGRSTSSILTISRTISAVVSGRRSMRGLTSPPRI